jgi:hypothetical protein
LDKSGLIKGGIDSGHERSDTGSRRGSVSNGRGVTVAVISVSVHLWLTPRKVMIEEVEELKGK